MPSCSKNLHTCPPSNVSHLVQDEMAHTVAGHGTARTTLLDDSVLIHTLPIHRARGTFDFDVVVEFRRGLEWIVHNTQPGCAAGISGAKIDRSPITVIPPRGPPKQLRRGG